MARTFIGNRKAPAPGPRRLAALVAAVCNGTGTGYDNQPGTAAKGRFQGDGHIAQYFNFSAHQVSQNGAHVLFDLRPASAGHANARASNLRRLNLAGSASLAHHRKQRLARALFPHANGIAAGGGATGQYALLIAQQAASLAATAINAQKVRHSVLYHKKSGLSSQ